MTHLSFSYQLLQQMQLALSKGAVKQISEGTFDEQGGGGESIVLQVLNIKPISPSNQPSVKRYR